MGREGIIQRVPALHPFRVATQFNIAPDDIIEPRGSHPTSAPNYKKRQVKMPVFDGADNC